MYTRFVQSYVGTEVASGSLATAATVTITNADAVLVQALGGDVYFSVDGTAATSGSFVLLEAQGAVVLPVNNAGATLSFLEKDSGATVVYQRLVTGA